MTLVGFIVRGIVNVVMQYLVFVIAYASVTAESMVGLMVAAFFQLAVISIVVRLHLRYWRP